MLVDRRLGVGRVVVGGLVLFELWGYGSWMILMWWRWLSVVGISCCRLWLGMMIIVRCRCRLGVGGSFCV